MTSLTKKNAKLGSRVVLDKISTKFISSERWIKDKYNKVATIVEIRSNGIVTLLWDEETENHDYSMDYLYLEESALETIIKNINSIINKLE